MTENCHSVMNLVVSTTETLLLHAHTLSYTSSSAGSCVSTAVQSSTVKTTCTAITLCYSGALPRKHS